MNTIKKYIYRQFKRTETDIHQLNYLFWECTTRCNLSCLHCGSDCASEPSMPDMPLTDFLYALDTIPSPSKHFTVVLTGGEPLLRTDLEVCGREIRKRGMRWSMVTNGFLYTPEKHNALLNGGLGALTMSLDGLEKSHDWLRNTKHSFEKVDKAIELAVSSSRLNFDVVTCVNQRNINELEAIYEYLKGKNVKAWRLSTIVPIGRAANNPELKLWDFQFEELMTFIEEKRKLNELDVKFSCEGYVSYYETKVRDGYFFCRAGINIGSILIDGSVSACPNIDRSFSQGNIYRENFYEVWQNKFKPFRNRSWTKTGQCGECDEYENCQGSGMHLWHGDKKNVLECHHEKLY
ncbi:MAG: TIGR04133 family radical SAM/SPASM protein [Paludibacter sp.]|nr:TIGR04133 family radical SAM/SPASM protein [Paludibacter sp.]